MSNPHTVSGETSAIEIVKAWLDEVAPGATVGAFNIDAEGVESVHLINGFGQITAGNMMALRRYIPAAQWEFPDSTSVIIKLR